PPRQFASGNVVPKATSRAISVAAGRSEAAGLSSDDAQVIVNVAAGAIPTPPGTITVGVTITPLDPATLGPLASNLHPDGNAYRIVMTPEPSHAPIGSLTQPGNIFLTLPLSGTALLYSPDGRSWQSLPVQHVPGQIALGAAFDRPGYYLAGTNSAVGVPGGGGSGSGSVILPVIIVILAALVIIGVPLVVRRLRTGTGSASGPRVKRPPRRR
ncbi:MAG TPA: hypothetical protein VF942_00885, partial [Acidimicrobiales bacterium]